MIPIPYEQVDEFLSWLSERHPSIGSETSDPRRIREVLTEYLRTKGKVGVLDTSYALKVFQVCPMIYEPGVREQMSHFLGCGGCIHYIHERHNEIPRLPQLHPLLDGFLQFCKKTEWGDILERKTRGIESPWLGEGPEYIDHLFRGYIHRVGSELSLAFNDYLSTADAQVVKDFEVNRAKWATISRRPLKVSRDWTEPLGMSMDLEEAAERLIGSVYLLLEGQFYKEIQEDPQVYGRLAGIGLMSRSAARGIEFFVWLDHKYPELDLFGSVPTEGINELVTDFCEEKGYTDSKSFAAEVMNWIRGDAEQLVLRRLKALSGRSKHDVTRATSVPAADLPGVSFHAIFLYHGSVDFRQFIKEHWKELNYITSGKMAVYYSLGDLERKGASAALLADIKQTASSSTPSPRLLIWHGPISSEGGLPAEHEMFPLERVPHEKLIDLIKTIVREVSQNVDFVEVVGEVQKYLKSSGVVPEETPQILTEEGDLGMTADSLPAGGEGFRHGGNSGRAARMRVSTSRFADVFAMLNASGLSDLADALKNARGVVLSSRELSDQEKQESVEVLAQIGEEVVKSHPNMTLLRSVSQGLKATLETVPGAASMISRLGEIIERRTASATDTTREIRTMIENLEATEGKRFRSMLLLVGIPAILVVGFAFWLFWQAQDFKMKSAWVNMARETVIRQQQIIDSMKAKAGQIVAASEIIRLGVIQYHARNYGAAIEAYDRAIELDPTNPVAYDLKGYALLKSGEAEKAVQSLRQAVELDPTYIWSHYDLSLAYWAIGDTGKAVAEVQRVLQLDPSFRETIRNDGQFSALRSSAAFQALFKK